MAFDPSLLVQPTPPDIIVTGRPLPRLHLSVTGMDQLKREETGGYWDGQKVRLLSSGTPALSAYPDSGGVWTIGWGATGKGIFKGVKWTILNCEVRLEADVSAVEGALRALLRGSPCTLAQFEAMVLLAYNIGETAFAHSTLLRFHLAGDYKNAALQFPRWCHDNGKVVAGLAARRAREQHLYETGSYAEVALLSTPNPTLAHLPLESFQC